MNHRTASQHRKTRETDIAIKLEDVVPPIVELRGSLFEKSWIRGDARLVAEALDLGGGLSFAQTSVNGTPVTGSASES